MRTRLVAPLAALLLFAGCGSANPRDTQTGYPGGFETEIHAVVQLKTPPTKPGDDTTLLTAVDNEVNKALESREMRDDLVASAIASYEQERAEDGTKIKKEDVEVIAQDYAVEAEDTAATRKMFEGKVTKFRFTLRRAKARILPEPTRVEALVFCVERSWAPGDTLRFPQIFRAEVMKRLQKAVVDVAKPMGLEPVEPRAPRTQ